VATARGAALCIARVGHTDDALIATPMPALLRFPASGPPPSLDGGSIFFVGTATLILRYAGLSILTDPNFLHAGDHVHLGYGLVSRRLTDPAIEIDALPPLDLVVLSHYHGDHFDRIAEARLPRILPIVTTPHAASRLRAKGFTETLALETWGSVRVEKGPVTLTITAMPARHGPPVVHALLPPVMGSLLEFEAATATRLRIYISGDTLVHDELRDIARRYPAIDLGIFHLGGTRVLGILVTMDAQQGVQALRIINPREAIPVHYNDYGVFRSPLADFRAAVEAAGLAERVRYLAHGETYEFQVAGSRRAASPRR
jgi:L-ascorbate metabolism protein UlaG (beta-lactamase superfamily)